MTLDSGGFIIYKKRTPEALAMHYWRSNQLRSVPAMAKPYFRSNYSEVNTKHQPPFDRCVCVPLTKGQHALVNADDFELVALNFWSVGSATHNGYAWASPTKSMHRTIMRAQKGQVVDHVNGNKLDNRRSNLRLCTVAQNTMNRSPNSDKVLKGVYLHKPSGKFYARIRVDGKLKHISAHLTPEGAAMAYDAAAIIYHRDFAKLNFPREQPDDNR